MNRQTELENVIGILWKIEDVTVDPVSNNAIKVAIKAVDDARRAIKREHEDFTSTRGLNNSKVTKSNNVLSGTVIKSSYVDCFGEECLLVNPDFIDNHDLYLVDYVIDNDIVQYTVFRDDEDQYYAVKGEY